MNRKPLVNYSIAFLVLLGAIGAGYYFSSQHEEPVPKKQIQIKKYVKTTPVVYTDIKTQVTAYGRVKSAEHLELLSEVAGRMYRGSVPLKSGINFKKGTLLFYIDDTEASFNLKSQKSNFLRDIAAILPDFKVDFKDNFEAWSTYFSSIDIEKDLSELPSTQSEKEKTFLATRGIYATFYSIKSAEARLKKHRYYAPFDGSITEVVMESGAFINPGTRIGRVMKANALELQVSVETRDVAWIEEGSLVAIWSDDTQQNFQGEVVRISDFVNPNTQSVDVFIRISPNGSKVYDGQFMRAAIPARVVKSALSIPRQALYNGNEVFVLEDTLLKLKHVTINRLLEEEAIVTGLTPDADLVVEPMVGAYNNMKAYKLDQKEINYTDNAAEPKEAASTN